MIKSNIASQVMPFNEDDTERYVHFSLVLLEVLALTHKHFSGYQNEQMHLLSSIAKEVLSECNACI